METEQITKGARADRRISKLVTFYESQLSSGDEQVQMQAAERLGDILIKQLELKDRQAERQLKRDLAGLRTAPLTTPAPAPQDRDELIRQLQREVASKARNKQTLATNDDSEKSFFD